MASRDYPPEVVDKALELAAAIGIRPAAQQLEIPYQTIHGWTRHPDFTERWSEHRRVNAPKWRDRAAIRLEELVDEYSAALAAAVERADEAIESMDPRDLGNFIRSIAVAQGIAADHVAKLRGQPAQVHELHANVRQLEAALETLRLEAGQAIDTTAEELLPAAAGN
jgi:hypothetical protein